jgi:hypothetical protein
MAKKILLVWESSRKDLLEPFLNLKDEFEFVVLWYKFPLPEPQTDFTEIYFGDYNTPYHILDEIEPQKIVFSTIHSYPQIALNTAAKNRGIATYIMHHGVYSSNVADLIKLKFDMGIGKKRKLFTNLSSFTFYLSALRPKNIRDLPSYLYYPYLINKYGSYSALKKCVFKSRLPSGYIQLSPHNAIINKRSDHLQSDEKFTYIGHPPFDKFLLDFNSGNQHEEPYWLLVDFPNTYNNLAFKKSGPENKIQFYKRLSAFAKEEKCTLKVKLHPAGYDSEYNYRDNNIELIRHADITALISKARRCFSFYSTLLIPIIFKKHHCFVFDVGLQIALQTELIELGVITKLDFKYFSLSEIQAPVKMPSPEAYNTFIERYIYITDGKATQRLKLILQN